MNEQWQHCVGRRDNSIHVFISLSIEKHCSQQEFIETNEPNRAAVLCLEQDCEIFTATFQA